MILHEIFRVVSRFPRYISCFIAEIRFSLGEYSTRCKFIPLSSPLDNHQWSLYQLFCPMPGLYRTIQLTLQVLVQGLLGPKADISLVHSGEEYTVCGRQAMYIPTALMCS